MKRTYEDSENSRRFQPGHPSETYPLQQNLQVKGVTRPAGRQQRPAEQHLCQSSCSRSSASAPLPSAGKTSVQQQLIHGQRNFGLLPQSGVTSHAPLATPFVSGPPTTSSAGLGITTGSGSWPHPHAPAAWTGQPPNPGHPSGAPWKGMPGAKTLTTQDAQPLCRSPSQHAQHRQQQHPTHKHPRTQPPPDQAGFQPLQPLQQRRILLPGQPHANAQQPSAFPQLSYQAPQTVQDSNMRASYAYAIWTNPVNATCSSVPQPSVPPGAPSLLSGPAPCKAPVYAPPTSIYSTAGYLQPLPDDSKSRQSTAPVHHVGPCVQEPGMQPALLRSDHILIQPVGSASTLLQAHPAHASPRHQLQTTRQGPVDIKSCGSDTRNASWPPQPTIHCNPNGGHRPDTWPAARLGQLPSDGVLVNTRIPSATSERQPSFASAEQQSHQQGYLGLSSVKDPCPGILAGPPQSTSFLPARTAAASESQNAPPPVTQIAFLTKAPPPHVQSEPPLSKSDGGSLAEACSHASSRECVTVGARNTPDELAKHEAVPSYVGRMPPVEKLKRPLRLKLSQWLPHAGVTAAFEAKGVTSLYPWQAAALECGVDGSNLVYCAPTSGGKSLVAEVLLIRRLVDALTRRNREQQRRGGRRPHPPPPPPRALLVLPYVSIVSEKTEHLTEVLAPLRMRVRGYTGAEQGGAPLAAPDEAVAVVTMEKANSTVNRLIAEGRLDELCCVVVDEAHMVGDPQRGICLELCLTKLRFTAAAAASHSPTRSPKVEVNRSISSSGGGPVIAIATATATAAEADAAGNGASVVPSQPSAFSCQLVCMSATMSGLDDLCGWLGARLFMTNFRPVPLTEHAVFQGKVFRKLTQRELREKQAVVEQGARPNGSAGLGTGSGPGVSLNESAAAGTSVNVIPTTTKPAGAPASVFTTAAALVASGPHTSRPGSTGSGTKGSGAVARGTAAGAVKSSAGGGATAVGSLIVSLDPLVEERDLPGSDPRDPDRLIPLVVEVAAQGHSTLVFCATRHACQGCAGLLAELLPKELAPASSQTLEGRRKLLTDLQDASGGYLSPELEKLIEAGVAYHHAGLTSQERSAVERGFRAGLIHTLTATSTLAAGINLPARRVILRSLRQGIGPVSRAQYLQMIGRAGRAGQSPIGEAVLVGRGAPYSLQGEWRDVCRLMTAPLPPLRCCLLDALLPAVDEEREGALGPRNGPEMRTATVAAGQGAAVAKGQAAKGEQQSAGGTWEGKGETHLQRMLLEAIANGSVATGATVEALIRTTLLYQQAGYDVIAAATHSALTALRNRRLVTYSAPIQPMSQPPSAAASAGTSAPTAGGPRGQGTQGQQRVAAAPLPSRKSPPGASAPCISVEGGSAGGGAGARWQPTQMGRAIYDSCLPTSTGEALYGRLLRAQDGLTLEGGLHLLALLLDEPLPVEIGNWEAWAGWLERMPREPHLRVAESLGVTIAYAKRLAGGRRGQPADSARHSRFASACLMHDVLCEGDLHELEAVWGAPGALTKNGITRGVLQKVQLDLSKWAGMAAVMAGSCGWWALQGLLEALSQQAAAGARPELLPLMLLPNMTGARARGLYAAGFTKPALLAVAAEEEVKKALASSLPRILRQSKPTKGSTESAVAAAATATNGNALVARGARALIESARKYMADMAARLAGAEAEADEGVGDLEAARRLGQELRAARSVGLADAGPEGYGGQAAVVVSREGGSPVATTSAAAAAAMTLRGSARIREISDTSSTEAIEAFLQAWRAQPSFAVAVISSRPLALEPELRAQQLQQLGIIGSTAAARGGLSSPPTNPFKGAPDPTGARPSPVNPNMMVPGPPPAAICTPAQSKTAPPPLGQSTPTGDGSAARLMQAAAARVGGDVGISCGGVTAGGTETGPGGVVEGLVVVWSHIDAVVLTFNHSGTSGGKAAGKDSAGREGAEVEQHMQGGAGGAGPGRGGVAKRKADKELGPGGAAKLRGAAPAVAARVDGGFGSAVGTAGQGRAPEQSPEAAVAVAVAVGSRSKLWREACEILGEQESSKVAWHAEAQVAALLAAGCEPAGQWDDPRNMAWLAMGTAGPQDILLPELQRSVLPSYAVRVPLQHRAAVTAACRTALSAWALVGPLRGMLAAEGMAAHYRLVEAPLTLALARTRLNFAGPAMPAASEPTSPRHTTAAPAAEDRPVPHHDPHNHADKDTTAPIATSSAASTPGEACLPSSAMPPQPPHSSSSPLTLVRHLSRPPAAGHLFLREAACRQRLATLTANRKVCERLVSSMAGRVVDLSQPAAVQALCGREYIVRRAGQLPPYLQVLWARGRPPPRFTVFHPRAGLPPGVRARAQVLALLLMRSAAVGCEAAVLTGLLTAAAAAAVDAPRGSFYYTSSTEVPTGATRQRGGSRSPTTASGGADVAGGLDGGGLICGDGDGGDGHCGVHNMGAGGAFSAGGDGGGAARFAIQRLGVEGRLGYVFGEEISGGGGSSGGATQGAAADGWVMVTELSGALVSAPSLQEQYCKDAEGLWRLQSLLPLPVLFLDYPFDPAAGTGAPPNPAVRPQLSSGWLLELQGPSPRMALQFGSSEGPQEDGHVAERCRVAVMAVTDPFTRQSVRVATPVTHVWCAASCCGPEQCIAAHQAGQMLHMTTPQVLRCPIEDLLQPPSGWVFVTVLYPYLNLAVAAHCSGDPRLVEALYHPDPWAELAAVWAASQAAQLRRLLRLPREPHAGAATDPTSIMTPSGLPLALMARGVLYRSLMGGCSHGELAVALELTGQGGPQGESGAKLAAAALVASFLEAFPGVAEHREELMAKAKKDGYVMTPGGQRLRPSTRNLTASCVAAPAKLQRLLSRMQMGGAVAEVVRTAVALCMRHVDEVLAQHHTACQQQQQQQQSSRPQKHPSAHPEGSIGLVAAATKAWEIGGRESAPAQASAPVTITEPSVASVTANATQLKIPSPPRASLVWIDEGQVTLCVPDGRLKEVMVAVQEASGSGVMSHLGLRVPLHVCIYHGRRLRLELCVQYMPGE